MFVFPRKPTIFGRWAVFRITSLKVWFHDDAPRTAKPANFVRWFGPDSVRWRSFAACLLSAPWASRTIATVGSFRSTEQRLLHQRNDRGVALPSHPWLGTSRDDRALASQRGVSVLGRTSRLPGGHDAAPVSGALCCLGARQICCTPRPLAKGNALPSSSCRDDDLRFGYNRPDCLWSAGTGGSRLQSQEARTPIVPAVAVLRGSVAGRFLWQLSPRQHTSEHGNPGTAGGRFWEASQHHPPGAPAGRWSILRSPDHRMYRGKTGLLCVCRSADSTTSKPAWKALLSTDCTRRMGAEFQYCPHGWKQPRRFVVIRRPIPEEPSAQLHLFQMGQYTYQVFVTNLALRPLNLWRFYNQRATAELIIRELKDAYALGKIPTKDFAANEAFFQIVLLAYNLLNWFKRLCVPPYWQRTTLRRMRQRLLVVPAQLGRPAGVPTLRIAPGYGYTEDFLNILKRIKTVRPLASRPIPVPAGRVKSRFTKHH